MGMMRWLAGLAGVVLLGTGAAAQDGKEGDPKPAEPADAVEAALDDLFASVDADKDGKITRDENYAYLRAQAIEALGGDESALEDDDLLAEWGFELARFLSADADDDFCATRAELRVFVRRLNKGMKAPSLSAKDIERLRTEVSRPFFKALVAECDTNRDGKLTAAEYEEFYGTEEQPDLDKNGTVTETEVETLVFAQIQANTGIEVKADAAQQPGQVKPEPDQPPVPAAEEPDSNQPKVEPVEKNPSKEAEKPAPDAFALYRKLGRQWTVQTTTADATTRMVSRLRYEVAEVGKDHAVLRCTMLDSEGKAMEGIPASDARIDFVAPNAGAAPKATGTATIRVTAGEFECDIFETSNDDGTVKTWVSRKFPGLLVKSESSARGWTTTQELTAFVE